MVQLGGDILKWHFEVQAESRPNILHLCSRVFSIHQQLERETSLNSKLCSAKVCIEVQLNKKLYQDVPQAFEMIKIHLKAAYLKLIL